MPIGLGELAAFTTAVIWAVSNQVHSAVGRKIGANGIVLLRMPYQVLVLGALCLLLHADTSMPAGAFVPLALSGLTGISFSDLLLYRAIYILGPTMSILLLSLSSGFTALFGWLFLGEVLPFQALAGIAVTLLGVGWVITERSGSVLLPGMEPARGKKLALGAVLGLSAAITLAASFILLKISLRLGVHPLWGTFVRMLFGAALLLTLGAVKGWLPDIARNCRKRPHLLWLLLLSCSCGAVGLWFAGVGMELAPVGVAATLIGLQPVMVVIVGALWYHRPPTRRILLGIVLAFCGTALICLR